jgi:carbonic anhydrase
LKGAVWTHGTEAAPPLFLLGDILALVFGLLFAATSIAFLVQMRRQHRYLLTLPLSTVPHPLCGVQNSRLHANQLIQGQFSDFSFLLYRHRSGTKEGISYSPAEMAETGA